MVTLDYLKGLTIIMDWYYDGNDDDLNTEFFKLGDEYSDDKILEYINPQEVDLSDEFGVDDFQDNLQDLLISERGDNAIIQTLCVKDIDGKKLIEY